jgi:hypothetical protein
MERRWTFFTTHRSPSLSSGTIAGRGVSAVRSGSTSGLRIGIMNAVDTT